MLGLDDVGSVIVLLRKHSSMAGVYSLSDGPKYHPIKPVSFSTVAFTAVVCPKTS